MPTPGLSQAAAPLLPGTASAANQGSAADITSGGSFGGWGGYGQPAGIFASGSQGGFNSNPNAYANEINQANASAAGYYGQGAGFQQAAPQATNPGQAASQAQLSGLYGGQNALAAQLQAQAQNPYSSQAVRQFNAGAGQAGAADVALGNSAVGGPIASAGARREGTQQAAVGAAQDVAARRQVAAQAQQAAQAQLGQLYGQQGGLANQQLAQEQAAAAQNAQLKQTQQGLTNATQMGLYGLSANEQAQAVAGATGYSNALLGEAGASNEEQQVSSAFGNSILGSAMTGAGAAYSGLSKAAGAYSPPTQGSGTASYMGGG